MKKKNTEYIIEMRDAAYILRDAGQSSQFRDCPAKCGKGGHPTETATRAPPQLHKTPPTREKAEGFSHGARQALAPRSRGGHYHKSQMTPHFSFVHRNESWSSSFILHYWQRTILTQTLVVCPNASISCHCLSSEMKTAI